MLSFFPQGVLDEILNLIESVSEGFPSYSCKGLQNKIMKLRFVLHSFPRYDGMHYFCNEPKHILRKWKSYQSVCPQKRVGVVGWCDDPTIWMLVGQGPILLAVGVGGGCLDIFTLLYPFLPSFSLSLGDGPI